ncbi:RidA family protein [Aerophototrophica crusticola]|uniref:RidA family protein n=1 Tax=Aerophototrophica crusticola TaxID=1709002 RepID=A0A858R3T8_9PROT|nr:RidA family protein [Rhodospirillaceae bacterium B3]
MRKVMVAAMVLAVMLPGAALAGARQDGTVLMPENPQMGKVFEEWGFAEAVVSGDTVYLSGVVAGLRPGETDLEAAFTRAFDYIGKTLARAGVGWGDVVDITTYHTDLKAQLDPIVAVKHRYVKAPFPAWTAIQVVRLVPDGGLVEIKVTARKAK